MADQPLPLVSLVDDQQIIAATLAMILSKSGFRAIAYTSPVEAFHAVESDAPSLLITDVNMPEMNGIELAIQFKLICPLCKVLLFSGHLATEDLIQIARAEGKRPADLS